MGKVELVSSSNDHWALNNNNLSFFDDTSVEDTSNVLLNLKKQIEVENDNSDSTNITKKREYNFNFDSLNKNYGIFQRKVYTKRTKTWKGQIISIQEGFFTAKLFEMGTTGTYESAQFNIKDDISEEDYELISIGAIFYWSVGSIVENRTQKKQSEIRLRRISSLSPSEFDEIKDIIALKYGKIKWE